VVAVVVVTGTVVVVVVVAGTVVVVGGIVVVVVARGSVVLVVVVEPRAVVGVATVLLVVVVGGLAVATTGVPGGAIGAVTSVAPLPSVLTNAVLGPDPCTANVVVVDLGGFAAADAPAGAARGAAATEVGDGTNGTPFALSARTARSVGVCE
jgi:hypothetical protein